MSIVSESVGGRDAAVPSPRLVYVAGPYTHPDPAENTHRAVKAAEMLIDHGFIPYVPHLTLLWQTISPKPYDFWLAYDLHWLRVCNLLLRMPGPSNGADKEVAEANRLGIPVFHSIADLMLSDMGWRK